MKRKSEGHSVAIKHTYRSGSGDIRVVHLESYSVVPNNWTGFFRLQVRKFAACSPCLVRFFLLLKNNWLFVANGIECRRFVDHSFDSSLATNSVKSAFLFRWVVAETLFWYREGCSSTSHFIPLTVSNERWVITKARRGCLIRADQPRFLKKST